MIRLVVVATRSSKIGDLWQLQSEGCGRPIQSLGVLVVELFKASTAQKLSQMV